MKTLLAFSCFTLLLLSAGALQAVPTGSLLGMGFAGDGQLAGIDSNEVSGTIDSPEGLGPTNVTAVSAGYYHCLWLQSDGSMWGVGQETIGQLPDFVRLAAEIGVREVHLQRLVFDDAGFGLARAESALFARAEEEAAVSQAQAIAASLGVRLNASGGAEPGLSLKAGADEKPWASCRRPWSLMYFTAHGRALPCCIAPFSARGYENYTLGDATQQSLREIWNSPAYRDFRTALLSDTPPKPCQGCGLRWSL